MDTISSQEKIIEILKKHTSYEINREKIADDFLKIIDQEIENRIRKLGVEIVKCKKCGADMIWLKGKSGKSLPTTLKLINHFIDCPSADEFRKKHV